MYDNISKYYFILIQTLARYNSHVYTLSEKTITTYEAKWIL